MQFCHPLNTPGLAKVHVPIAVALPQRRIKHFLLPGCTTVTTISSLTTEVKEEKDLSALPNLCF